MLFGQILGVADERLILSWPESAIISKIWIRDHFMNLLLEDLFEDG